MIPILEISNAIHAGRSLEYEKIDKDFLRVSLPRFDVATGLPADPEAFDVRVQDVINQKVLLERELDACEVLLNNADLLGLESK